MNEKCIMMDDNTRNRKSDMKNKLFAVLLNIAVFIGLIYPLTNSIFVGLTQGRLKTSVPFITSTILLILLVVLFIQGLKISRIGLFVFIVYSLFLVDMSFRGTALPAIVAEYVMVLSFIVFLSQTDVWISFTIKICYLFGLFYVGTVWVQYFFPDSFARFALPLLLDDYQSKFLELNSWGYNCGLTSEVGITCCYIIIAFATILSNLIYKKHNDNKFGLFNLILFAYVMGSFLITGKRSSFVIVLIILALIFCLQIKDIDKRIFYIFALSMLIILFNYFLLPLIETLDFSSLTTLNRMITLSKTDDITNGRINLVNDTLKIITDYPLTGIGWGRFPIVSNNLFNAHNIYLQLLAEQGIIWGSFTIICIFYFFLKSFILYNDAVNNIDKIKQPDFIKISFSFVIQLYILIYGFSGNPIFDVEYIALNAISITILLSIINSNNDCFYQTNTPKSLARCARTV